MVQKIESTKSNKLHQFSRIVTHFLIEEYRYLIAETGINTIIDTSLGLAYTVLTKNLRPNKLYLMENSCS